VRRPTAGCSGVKRVRRHGRGETGAVVWRARGWGVWCFPAFVTNGGIRARANSHRKTFWRCSRAGGENRSAWRDRVRKKVVRRGPKNIGGTLGGAGWARPFRRSGALARGAASGSSWGRGRGSEFVAVDPFRPVRRCRGEPPRGRRYRPPTTHGLLTNTHTAIHRHTPEDRAHHPPRPRPSSNPTLCAPEGGHPPDRRGGGIPRYR